MAREPILGQLDRDLACAIALGIVEHRQVVATLDQITLHDSGMRLVGSQAGWLDGDDPLDIATREFLKAKRDINLLSAKQAKTPWASASKAKERDEATRRSIEAKKIGRDLLEQRGVLARARAAGMRVLE